MIVTQLGPTLCDPMDCSLKAPLSMGFSKQEYWSGLPFPSPGDHPDPGLLHGRQILYHLSHQEMLFFIYLAVLGPFGTQALSVAAFET